MPLFKRLLQEPVVHFLVAGALLYSTAAWMRGPELYPADDSVITVDRDNLLTFLQFRSNAFDKDAFDQALDSMSETDLQQLIDAYIDEEVLYREARSLDLENSDYIIRQRMVEKMKFLLGDLAGGEVKFTEQELADYFEENRDVWRVLPSATLTHVFFSSEQRGAEQARNDALAAVADFNQHKVGFNDAEGAGDRFPFLRNYVERTLDYLEGQFGVDFVEQLATLSASEQWQGPLPSAYGWHIVLLTDIRPARYPTLDEVRADVERDFIRERSEALLKEITASVRERYEIRTETLRSEPQQ